MNIQIHDIPSEGLELSLDQSSDVLRPILAELHQGEAPASLRVQFRFRREEAVIAVEGEMSGDIVLSCSRCTDPVPLPIHETFRFFLRNPLQEDELSRGEDVELSEESLDYGFIEAGGIDVANLVREQLMLALPSQPLCKVDCKGICQRCGADLNREPCQCTGPDVDPRFAMLKQLKLSS